MYNNVDTMDSSYLSVSVEVYVFSYLSLIESSIQSPRPRENRAQYYALMFKYQVK